jgi:hypothetical protein
MATYEIQEGQTVVGNTPEIQEGGYFNTNYHAGQANQAAQEEGGLAGAAQTINELAAKLGVDPASLAAPESMDTPTVTPQVEPTEEVDYMAKFNTEEGKRFRSEFKNYLGIDPVEAYNLIQTTSQLVQHLDGWRGEVVHERQMDSLKKEFGAEFDTIMPEVVERFSKLPKAQQVALDNADGARMLAAMIRQEKLSQKGGRVNPYASTNVRPLPRSGNGSPVIKMSEFVNWTDAEVQSRMPDIIKAKQSGTFINDL